MEAQQGMGAAATRTNPSSEALVVDPDSPALFRPGTRIEHYEVIRELGRGGMGVVYLARDEQLGRRVAIKALLARHGGDANRFLHEARATAKCNHENIVVIHGVNLREDGVPYMVLEHLDGSSLSEILEDRRVSIDQALEFVLPIVRALRHAHGLGIVHRDLKPSNVFVTRSGVVKVLDFGIAKALGAGDVFAHAGVRDPSGERTGGGRGGTTERDAVVGTARFMAPEQWASDVVDGGADIWAVGVLLHVMVTGESPTDVVPRPEIEGWALDLGEEVPSVGTLVEGLPEAFVKIVDRCLRKRRSERYENADALLAALEALASERSSHKLDADVCPYPGLVAFTASDADRYFGRDAEVRRAVSVLKERPVVAIAGPSGRGKSSFARAGVLPALQATGEAWDVMRLRPGRDPLVALLAACKGVEPPRAAGERDHAPALPSASGVRARPGMVGTFLRDVAQRRRRRMVVFVDQFEELFTLVSDPDERIAFADCLLGIADDPTSPLRVLLSIRSDFIDRFSEHERLAEEVASGLILLPAMSRSALRRAIVRPAELAGYAFEDDDIVESMLAELEATTGALSLMQFAAASLWDARDESRKLLTRESYDAMGGIAGTLAAHADATLAGLGPNARVLARRMLLRLVTPERTRALIDRSELLELGGDPGESETVIDHLVASRLLTTDARDQSEDAVVELVHESLIDRWPTLRRWLEESAEDAAFVAQLRESARQWERRGEPQGLLWRGDAAEEARRFLQRPHPELAGRERRYLDAAISLADRAHRLRRRLFGGAFVILAALVVGAGVALIQIRTAEQAAREAEKEAKNAEALAVRQAEAARVEAARAQTAEQKVQQQLELLQAEEAARRAAEHKASDASEDLQKTNAELAKSNAQLQAAAEKAREAAAAAAAATEAEKNLRRQVESLLEKERKRVQELEKQRGKIITDLE